MYPERIPNRELLNLRRKVALVTGGAQGIGYEISKRLAEANAVVIVADKNKKEGYKAVASLELPKWHFTHVDVANRESVVRMVTDLVSLFSRIDILVNNAGIYPFKPMLRMTLEEWQTVLSTNLTSTFNVNQLVARQMVESGRGGKIINIGSVDSLSPWKVGSAAYDASKAGILGMSKSLALELGPHNITVNVIAPGDIDTPGSRGEGVGQILDLKTDRIPLGRQGTADDVAMLALFLASPMSDYVTGSIYVVDGGWMLTSSNTPVQG